MKKNIFIYLAPWDHFRDESGFNIISHKIKNLLVSYSRVFFISDSNNSLYFKFFFKLFIIFSGSSLKKNNWTPFIQEINHFKAFYFSLFSKILNSRIILLASENQFSGRFLFESQLRKKTILFIHQPPSWFKINHIDLRLLNDVKGIIVFSKSQKQFFSENVICPIYFFRHGVNTNVFNILPIRKKKLILVVGQHLRNFDIVLKTIFKVWETDSSVLFNFVIPIKYRPQVFFNISGDSRVTFHDNISTTDLVTLYNFSLATFLPLNDSTANNAINESLACGTPVITNKVGGVMDYLSSEYSIILDELDVDKFSEAILKIVSGKVQFSQAKIRKYAERYLSWDKVLDFAFLKQILE